MAYHQTRKNKPTFCNFSSHPLPPKDCPALLAAVHAVLAACAAEGNDAERHQAEQHHEGGRHPVAKADLASGHNCAIVAAVGARHRGPLRVSHLHTPVHHRGPCIRVLDRRVAHTRLRVAAVGWWLLERRIARCLAITSRCLAGTKARQCLANLQLLVSRQRWVTNRYVHWCCAYGQIKQDCKQASAWQAVCLASSVCTEKF